MATVYNSRFKDTDVRFTQCLQLLYLPKCSVTCNSKLFMEALSNCKLTRMTVQNAFLDGNFIRILKIRNTRLNTVKCSNRTVTNFEMINTAFVSAAG